MRSTASATTCTRFYCQSRRMRHSNQLRGLSRRPKRSQRNLVLPPLTLGHTVPGQRRKDGRPNQADHPQQKASPSSGVEIRVSLAPPILADTGGGPANRAARDAAPAPPSRQQGRGSLPVRPGRSSPQQRGRGRSWRTGWRPHPRPARTRRGRLRCCDVGRAGKQRAGRTASETRSRPQPGTDGYGFNPPVSNCVTWTTVP